MPTTIALVGAGRVGQTLGRALRRRGYPIGAVVTRHLSTARAATRFIGAGQARGSVGAEVARGDTILVATSDRAIAQAAHALAGLEADWRKKVVLHTSGALSSHELIPLEELGAAVGSLHPLYPFPRPLRQLPRGVVFGIEGDRRAAKVARALVLALGGHPLELSAEEKPLYHAAAALVAGHLMTLVDLGTRLLAHAGVPPARARAALMPLVRETLESYARWGPQAWTGPLRRGDAETLWHHLVGLKALPRHYREVYVALARAAVALYRTDRGQATKELRRLLEM
ncbi:MAG: DUF2520 domain-containing protein [Acidobacteria bacterium]|nr:DUF2520 domain-containing protein [Acidobacteriota bacterium]